MKFSLARTAAVVAFAAICLVGEARLLAQYSRYATDPNRSLTNEDGGQAGDDVAIYASSQTDANAERRINEKLKTQVNVNFQDETWASFVKQFEVILGEPVRLDTAQLQEIGFEPDSEKVSGSFRGSARSMLDAVLDKNELSWCHAHDALFISTKEKLSNRQTIRLYPVGDLLTYSGGFDDLIDLLTTTVNPTAWDEVGGSESIRGYRPTKSLVVNGQRETHEQIAILLSALRRSRTPFSPDGANVAYDSSRRAQSATTHATTSAIRPLVHAANTTVNRSWYVPRDDE